MKVIKPLAVTEGSLTSVNVPEDDHDEWSNATEYSRGDFVISLVTHTVYRSLQDANTGNDPDAEQVSIADPLIDPPDTVFWQVMGATNRWRLFDQKPSQVCASDQDIVVVVEPGRFVGGLAGFNITADSVRVEVFDGAAQIFDRTIAMSDNSAVVSWTTYFTSPFVRFPEFVITDLPLQGSPRIQVTFSSVSGSVSVGQLIIGEIWDFGTTRIDGSGFSGLDFSFVETDEFGNLTTVQREATRISDFAVVADNQRLFRILQQLRSLRGGVAAVWIGGAQAAHAAVIYGFARDYSNVYQTTDVSVLSIEVQGII